MKLTLAWFFHSCSSHVPDFNLAITVFSYQVSLIFSDLWWLPQSFLVFPGLWYSWGVLAKYFVQEWNISTPAPVFLMFSYVYTEIKVLHRVTQEWSSLLSHHIRGYVLPSWLHWWIILSLRLKCCLSAIGLHCKVTTFPFP